MRQRSYNGREQLHTLFARGQAGDREALDDFCMLIRPGLLLILRLKLKGWPSELIEDLVQDTLLTIVTKAASVEGSPTSFALTILHNKIGNVLKRKASLREVAMQEGNPGLDEQAKLNHLEFMNTVEQRDTLDAAVQVISKMNDPCRTLLIGTLEEKSMSDLWLYYSVVVANPSRSKFYKQLKACQRQLLRSLEES